MPDRIGPAWSGSGCRCALLLLAAAYACHSMDRQVLSVVVEPVKREFGASDAAMGLLGFAYAAAFAATCLPVGPLADRLSQRCLSRDC